MTLDLASALCTFFPLPTGEPPFGCGVKVTVGTVTTRPLPYRSAPSWVCHRGAQALTAGSVDGTKYAGPVITTSCSRGCHPKFQRS